MNTLRTEEREEELNYALKNINCDILGLCEIRRMGETIIEKNNGDLFCYIGQTKGQKGVGFLIKKHIKPMVKEIIGVSERIIVLKIKTATCDVTMIQIYAPTENHSDEDSEDFYRLLEDTIERHRSHRNFILGDFNSKVGNKLHAQEDPVGPYGYGTRNARGERLVQFATEQRMVILNTFFRKRSEARWTWRHPNGTTKNELDYILTDSLAGARDIQVVPNLKFSTDHRMVRATVNIKRNRRHFGNTIASTIDSLDRHTFGLALQERLQEMDLSSQRDPQDLYNSIEEALTQASITARRTNGTRENSSKLSPLTIALIEQRKRLYPSRDENEDNKNQYAEIDKQTKRAIRRDVREHNTEAVRTILESSKSTRQARKQRGSGKQWLLGARGPRGNRLTEREDIVTAATNYYRSLYTSSKQEANPSDSIQMNNVDDIEVPPILQSEVRTAIGELKSGKAPGEDNIHNEHLKLGHDSLLTPLTAVFNEILKSETVPHQWKTSKIILLHKKGAKDDLNNYRPISLMSNVYKLFSKIITRRLTKVLDDNQAPDQAGFRSGYSTVDHLQTINQVIEKTDEFNIPLYLAFIDFKKAFDSVEHSCVLQALSNQGVEHKYINILTKLYGDSHAIVMTEREGQIFRIGRGVRQGDPISPKLFTSLLEDIFRKLKWKKRHGININGYRLTNLRFADDIVLFAKNATDLQEMIQELSDCSAHAGLSMNMEKTQVMTNSQPQPIQVNATRLQYVEEYIYLGQLVGFKSCMTRELKRRIASAWRAFWSLQFILLDKKLNRKLKLEVLQSCIFPTLLYGCQTWKLTVNQKTQIQICQRKMERKILGLSLRDKISNTRLKQMTNTRDMAHQGERLKWKWGGHVSRLQGCRWAHISTTWDPRIGRRNRGRPGTRWADFFKSLAGPLWSRTAKNREEWRSLQFASIE